MPGEAEQEESSQAEAPHNTDAFHPLKPRALCRAMSLLGTYRDWGFPWGISSGSLALTWREKPAFQQHGKSVWSLVLESETWGFAQLLPMPWRPVLINCSMWGSSSTCRWPSPTKPHIPDIHGQPVLPSIQTVAVGPTPCVFCRTWPWARMLKERRSRTPWEPSSPFCWMRMSALTTKSASSFSTSFWRMVGTAGYDRGDRPFLGENEAAGRERTKWKTAQETRKREGKGCLIGRSEGLFTAGEM